MRTYVSKGPLLKALEPERRNSRSIGFVPTMGALHSGHKSLVEASVKENDLSVVSIFVNPAQFNDPGDFERYPRNSKVDIEFLGQVLGDNDIVYLPEVKEIYPDDTLMDYDLKGLDKTMEGEFRPGHFRGVVNVIGRFFEIIQPDRAYFGEKDFQQYVIIDHLSTILNYHVQIIPVPTVREPDGLALSSRNVLLNSNERVAAANISRILKEAVRQSKNKTISEVREWVIITLNIDPLIRVEYFEIVDSVSLKPVDSWVQNGSKVGCIAAWAGGVRLIDNIRFYS